MLSARQGECLRPLRERQGVRDDFVQRQFRVAEASQRVIEAFFVIARADNFLFAQMQSPELAPDEWEPAFVDYLYLSFTNAAAFSPTDVLPLSRWAKLTMLIQSAISLSTVALVVARAVNILR